ARAPAGRPGVHGPHRRGGRRPGAGQLPGPGRALVLVPGRGRGPADPGGLHAGAPPAPRRPVPTAPRPVPAAPRLPPRPRALRPPITALLLAPDPLATLPGVAILFHASA